MCGLLSNALWIVIGYDYPSLPHTFGRTQVEYPEIEEDTKPRYRFMSAFEQRVEVWGPGCGKNTWWRTHKSNGLASLKYAYHCTACTFTL